MSNSWCIMTPNTTGAFVTVGACVSWSRDFCSLEDSLEIVTNTHKYTHEKASKPLDNKMIMLESWTVSHFHRLGYSLRTQRQLNLPV